MGKIGIVAMATEMSGQARPEPRQPIRGGEEGDGKFKGNKSKLFVAEAANCSQCT